MPCCWAIGGPHTRCMSFRHCKKFPVFRGALSPTLYLQEMIVFTDCCENWRRKTSCKAEVLLYSSLKRVALTEGHLRFLRLVLPAGLHIFGERHQNTIQPYCVIGMEPGRSETIAIFIQDTGNGELLAICFCRTLHELCCRRATRSESERFIIDGRL